MSDQWCEVCDGAEVRRPSTWDPHVMLLDWNATTANVMRGLEAGQMTYVRFDVPVEDMSLLAQSELKYTIMTYLRCEVCGRDRAMGLCIRGEPIFRVAQPGDAEGWPWEKVPDESLWKRTPPATQGAQ